MKKLIVEIFKRAVAFPIRNLFILLNQKVGNFENIIWLIGDGRSGTTWVSSIINSKAEAREFFEPYHIKVLAHNQFIPYKYSTPSNISDDLLKVYGLIFSGRLLHRRADFGNLKVMYNGMIVKDIFISLSAFAISLKFPNVKPVLLIRNPFAVVHSKMKKADAYWPTDLEVYLNDNALIKRLGYAIEKLLIEAKKRNNFIEIQFINWCLGNLIPLQDFSQEKLHLLFYEDIKEMPTDELFKLKKFLGDRFSFVTDDVNREVFDSPSRVVSNAHRVEHENSFKYWQGLFGAEEFEIGMSVLNLFEMDKLYSSNGKPNRTEFKRFGFIL